MNSFNADSSSIWGCEGNLYNPLLHEASISDSLPASSKAAFDFGNLAASSRDCDLGYGLHGPFEPHRLASVSLSQDSLTGTLEDENEHRPRVRSTLPLWAMSAEGHVHLSLADIVHRHMLEKFARDRLGCQHLQQAYHTASAEEKAFVANEVLGNITMFQSLSCDVFGNFFIQKLIELANPVEMEMATARLREQMFNYCHNRYSCRVVQKALEHLPLDMKLLLVRELHHTNVVRLFVDQNGNHVIQKIINCFPLAVWAFLLDAFLTNDENLFMTAEDKYGCRIVQLAVERLSAMEKNYLRERYLDRLMKLVIRNCHRLTLNEYSNYVIQFIIGAATLGHYRDQIIQQSLLKNILSMAQEKYASHVIEKAMEHAPPHLLKEMMNEIFDGYVPHPESRRDALEIIMFHQYGNYIIQRMLKICVAAARAKSSDYEFPDMSLRLTWLSRLCQRIIQNEGKLLRYSSGKKIMDMLQQIPLSLRPSLPMKPLEQPRSRFDFEDPFSPTFDYSFFAFNSPL